MRFARWIAVLCALGLAGGACAVIEVPVPQEGIQGHTDDLPEVEFPSDSVPRDDWPVGANALAYLRSDVPRLVIEIDAVEGREPSSQATAHVVSVLESVLDKPGGIDLRVQTISATQEEYSIQDVQALERLNRDTSSSGEEASLYLLSLNGEAAAGPGALGVSFSASSFAIFMDQIRAVGGPLADSAALERAVMVHEVGHLLRLVNIGYQSPREREDPDSPHHSQNEDSVMHAAVQVSAIGRVFGAAPPGDFDADDRADLEGLRSGELG